jgi:hypothetical protein
VLKTLSKEEVTVKSSCFNFKLISERTCNRLAYKSGRIVSMYKVKMVYNKT